MILNLKKRPTLESDGPGSPPTAMWPWVGPLTPPHMGPADIRHGKERYYLTGSVRSHRLRNVQSPESSGRLLPFPPAQCYVWRHSQAATGNLRHARSCFSTNFWIWPRIFQQMPPWLNVPAQCACGTGHLMQAAGRRKAGKKESESLVSHGPSHSYPKQQTLSAGPTVAFP